MYHFATVTSKNYLTKTLVLYETILNNIDNNFKLNVLVVDHNTCDLLKQLNLNHINVFGTDNINDEVHIDLVNNISDVKPKEKQISYYCGYVKPLFADYLFNNYKMTHMLFMDSDLCFYDNPSHLIKVCDNYDLGFSLNKTTQDVYKKSGYFNSGLWFARKNKTGKNMIKWWKKITSNPFSNEWFNDYGGCIEQQYVDLFWDYYNKEKIKVIDSDIGYSAKWNMNITTRDEDFITWNCDRTHFNEKYKTQKLYCHHFSAFRILNFEKDLFLGSSLDNVRIHRFVKEANYDYIYEDYYKKNKHVYKKYNLGDSLYDPDNYYWSW